jgi:hypothetical protein
VLLFAALLWLAPAVPAQEIRGVELWLPGLPPGGAGGACLVPTIAYFNLATGVPYVCPSGTLVWTALATSGSAITGGTCTNQAVTAISTAGVPTCTTLTSSYVDTSIAKTGTDINTSNQVTATHLASALPVNQGGTAATTAIGAVTNLASGYILCRQTTAVSTGADTTVDLLFGCTVPIDTLTANSTLKAEGHFLVSAGVTCTAFIHWSNSASTNTGTGMVITTALTPTRAVEAFATLSNRNSVSSQSYGAFWNGTASTMNQNQGTTSLNTHTTTLFVNFEMQNGANTDTCTLNDAIVTIWP